MGFCGFCLGRWQRPKGCRELIEMGLLCSEGGWGMKAVQGEGRRGRGGLSLLGASLVSLPFKPGWRTQRRWHCPGDSRRTSHQMTLTEFYCGEEGRLVEPAARG